MKRTAIMILILIAGCVALSQAKNSSCVKCHLSGDWVSDTTIAASFMAGDIHYNMGLDCADCHGGDPKRGFEEGDPDIAMDPAKGYRPPPGRLGIPDFCSRCHSDIEYMKDYNPRLPTDQLKLYKTSVHGKQLYGKKDTKVAICNNCHGNHGATPPNLASVSAACGECHAYARDFFNGSPHKEAFKELGYPECEQCHDNHYIKPVSDDMIGVGDKAVCIECHDEGSEGYQAAASMRASIDSLIQALDSAEEAVREAEQKGVEGGQARFDLGAANDNLTRARSVIHTFDPDQVTEVTAPGIKTAAEVKKTALAALGDIKIRQIGLAISLIVVLFVALVLWGKIKQVDSRTDFAVKNK